MILADAGLQPGDVSEVLHGTTVGSNTLLQKAGAKTGLLTTRGFRDVLEIGRIRTPDMFDLTWDKPQPLVPPAVAAGDRRADRCARAGADTTRSDAGDARSPAISWRAALNRIAICFINSYRNPAHEIAAETILRLTFPQLPVTTSVSVLPEQREYERTSTAVVNAYVLPVMRTYLQRLRLGLQEIGITAPLLVGEFQWRPVVVGNG